MKHTGELEIKGEKIIIQQLLAKLSIEHFITHIHKKYVIWNAFCMSQIIKKQIRPVTNMKENLEVKIEKDHKNC